ncbi:arginine/ornithine antiporter ArcD [Halarchaeum nitratireducens]|uniref:Arginine:ornithine antiporter n=1 Tax=Halarchaeum nitratireducens TaxID=489913 RepID=A0A830G8I7_9EURY|nr:MULTISPECIES: Na+/H+ antiporter NhaC family protein [Halarchaeum]MBP2250072.1 NhaC family Na+:H+ antiporter [Halarchaeum solikamskense]GGN08654.1 arginine:ornithine antiporter [Halarchaeum nitratireducens]
MSDLDFDPLSYEELPPERRPSLAQALVPVAGMLVFLGAGRLVFGLDPQFPLLLGVAFTALCARRWFDLGWRDLYDGAADSITMGLQAVLILFIVYALISTWIAAGTIPAIMYYGLGVLTPKVFLPAACVLAAVVSFSIGSSWTTAGTLGVAFIGIGHGLGIPAPMTAGAILSGAYAGDKQSPLSDTTNLAAAATETDLFEHVDAMRVGTGLAFLVALVAYAALGLHAGGDIPVGQVEAIRTAIVGSYDVGLVVLLPLVLTFALALYGIPALPSLGTGVFAGIATTIVFQEGPVVTTAPLAFHSGPVTHAFTVAQSGTSPSTSSDLVNNLLSSSGLTGASWVVTIVLAALALGGMLTRAGVLAAVANAIAARARSVGSLTATTAVTAFSMNVLAADQYISIVVPGMTYRGLYEDFGLDSANLSRAVEAAGTTTSAFVPWNSGGVYMAGVLGVVPIGLELTSGGLGFHLLGYAPYYFFGFLSPAILLVMGFTGWCIRPAEGVETPAPGAGDDA